MKVKIVFLSLATALLMLLGTGPGLAVVFVQCPTDDGSGIVYDTPLTDTNGDGMIRADDDEIPNAISPNQVCIHLAAGDGFVNMADGREQYMFGFANATGINDDSVMHAFTLAATFPAPMIKVKEGDEVYLSLTNVGMMNRPDLFDPHTIHWHGFPNASAIFDGVPDASVSINMGSTLTYYYQVVEPGTYMYHCHVEATEHMQMGMLGNLYVTPASDTVTDQFAYNDGDGSTGYDVDYAIQITAFDPVFHDASRDTQPLPFANMDDKYPMINGRGYPDTKNPATALPYEHGASSPMPTVIEATAGERILLRLSSLSTTSFHTIGTIGLPMQVVGKGSRKLGPTNNTELYYFTNSITLGGGESYDVIVDTAGVAPGRYFLYTTNLDHLVNNDEITDGMFGGMMTEIIISGAP